ncbi:MAG: hypothetical protein JWP03_1923 [Phycisphaerales bacterium]|nr:hypothetical protein [Phycisphaerales bacterium]
MPTDARAETVNRIGLCIDCNYPLQGLADPRCPECGRGFDPANPKTMNLGRPIGSRARWLLRPTGRPTVVVALLALIAMLAVTRPPLGAPSLAAARYWLQPRLWKTGTSLVTWRDWTYTIGLVMGIVATAVICLRTILRVAVTVLWRQFPRRSQRGRRRTAIALAAIVCASFAGLVGWPVQVGQHWMACLMRLQPNVAGGSSTTGCPVPLSPEEESITLHVGMTALPATIERLWGTKVFVERRGLRALPVLIETLRREKAGSLRAVDLHLIALSRNDANIGLFKEYLADPDPEARAAAVDGLGMIYTLAYPTSNSQNPYSEKTAIATDPPIDTSFMEVSAYPRNLASDVNTLLRNVMLSGASAQEREAAARALLPWPPDNYRLRVAEWGVWISDGGELKLVRSVLDEIPPFVSRTANPLSELVDRINPILIVDKPVIHLTVNDALAVDLSAMIRSGRPWFACPRPDDFSVSVGQFDRPEVPPNQPEVPKPLARLENAKLGSLSNAREGYPWLKPQHRTVGPLGGSGGWPTNEIDGLGLRWQSLIVSPVQLPWMVPPPVPADLKYAWWNRLRQVPTSWISSRGESERFLYYDGPTLAKTPVDTALIGAKLHLNPRALPPDGWLPEAQIRESEYRPSEPRGPIYPVKDPATATPSRQGFFVKVAGGKVTGQQVDVPYVETDVSILPVSPLIGPEVKARFDQMLQDAGLTGPEAAGLIACWTPQFFEKEGTRFLLLLSEADYDALCPMKVRPVPTERARVGIVLTEF